MAFLFLRRVEPVAIVGFYSSWISWCEEKEEKKLEMTRQQTTSIEDESRYLGYTASLTRLKTLLLRAKSIASNSIRYVAYSSDIGESMRPLLRPWAVNATYGIAIGYVLLDAGFETRRKHLLGVDNDVLVATAAHRLIFHTAVSLALPAVIIHSAVHRAHHFLHQPMFETMPRLIRYGPTVIGLSIIPFLPIVDEPAEHILDWSFDLAYPKWRIGQEESSSHHASHSKSD
uniref:Mitochondrial fission process protein 1 n=1 Tax=Aureoumbra lagunensis TaxID=44058 RepID=A0A6S7ZI55_9STRA|mmetsp:Transcript_3336/g.4636  ORF Transcript_3336/g.4636 Transcript_3336/m.4636 type:complete len:230 (-) Transcript_3336:181-870(-)|eukprot:CAMPEP_0197310418 /NCGR_PEP_ID=MMETSP0891-20130614/8997_1 /TAXON_ID=44058 ORGANISM="Aureoumbra lagunensis, Strain CCMP1510" /NCGR_SAMPLE_ID=MMETSP0891 /ASSEMBLY_ACC=CAM_ASM_000534 /LENGTH=229 /DNA_ID=CAMNT_0042796047 /DNA_START=54 /DNA_END=743 /DNA_ORIENTATION=+